jgi:hypothetical protein
VKADAIGQKLSCPMWVKIKRSLKTAKFFPFPCSLEPGVHPLQVVERAASDLFSVIGLPSAH